MKKFLFLLCSMILIGVMVIPCAGLAETETAPDVPVTDVGNITDPVPAEPYTWQYLATLAGATAATLLIVQFCKVPLDKVWKIPTRVFVYIVALAILLIATAFTSGLTLENAPLAAVNAFLVALTAYGSYEVTFAKFNK